MKHASQNRNHKKNNRTFREQLAHPLHSTSTLARTLSMYPILSLSLSLSRFLLLCLTVSIFLVHRESFDDSDVCLDASVNFVLLPLTLCVCFSACINFRDYASTMMSECAAQS